MLDAIAAIGNAFNGTVDRMAQLFGTKTYATKVEEERQKALELEIELARLNLEATQNQQNNMFAANQAAASTQWIQGIDNEKVLIYGGAGLGGLLLLLIIIVALK